MRVLSGLAAALVAGFACAADPAVDTNSLWGARLFDLEERPVTLEPLRGRPLVANFWARWCDPCRREIPELVKQRNRFKDRGLEVVGIALDDKPESVRDFARAYDIDYPVLLAKGDGIELLKALGNRRAVLPYTLVLNRRGEVVAVKLGPMSESEMADALDAAAR